MANFGFHTTAEQVTKGLDLSGHTYLITGCNSGLGYETARVLALRGARIIGLARTEAKASKALGALGIDGVSVACELSDLDSVRAAVARVRQEAPIDGLIANAGIMALPTLQQAGGYELQFYTNHIGHFALVTGLLDRLATGGRVVMLSSGAVQMAPEAGIELDNLSGERDYHPWKNYGQSKLANLLFARSLAARLDADKTANSLHPGVIFTNLGRHVENPEAMYERMKKMLKTVEQGASTQCYVATHPDNASVRGAYFSDCAVAKPRHAKADDDALAEALWERSEAIIAA